MRRMNSVAVSVMVFWRDAPAWLVVGVAEAHGAVVEAAQALVGDGDPVGVAAEVVEDLFGAGEGSLRIDHPVGLAGRAEMLGEKRRGSLRACSRPAKRSCPDSKASCSAARRTRRK